MDLSRHLFAVFNDYYDYILRSFLVRIAFIFPSLGTDKNMFSKKDKVNLNCFLKQCNLLFSIAQMSAAAYFALHDLSACIF